MFRNESDEDLRVEIFHLKKQLSNTSAENQLLKVKIRKLQNEIVRKDKEIDVVLDPRKSTDVRKILYERSASFVLNMKEKNDELLYLLQEKDSTDVRKILYERSASFVLNMKEKNDELLYLLQEKDVIIRRLQSQLEVTKLYSQTPRKHFQCIKCTDHADLDNKLRQIHLKVPCFKNGSFGSSSFEDNGKKKKKKNRSLSWTPDLQEESTLMEDDLEEKEKAQSSYDVKDQYKSLSREHLLSIIENLKNNQRSSPTSRQTSSRKSSPESDLERIELLCESPHEEIQQLHLHFLDMISEVDHLKNTIAQLQNNQEKTENVLKKKDNNIDKLAQEIKNLKRPKSRSKANRNRNTRTCSSADLVARVYSANANTNQRCSKYEKEIRRNKNNENTESTNNRRKKINSDSDDNKQKSKDYKHTKDAMIQVEDIESPNRCMYVEKGSITITQKTVTSQTSLDKDYAYEDEVFEEIDEESAADGSSAREKE